MFKRKNKKLIRFISPFLIAIFLTAPFFVAEKSFADSTDENTETENGVGDTNDEKTETEEEIFSSRQTVGEIENRIANNQKEWKNLQEQRNYYLSILQEKQDERASLENQISILDAQISKAELDIKATQSEIEKIILEIQKITLEIQKKEEEIVHQKEVIGELIRKIYEYDEKTLLETLLENETLSEFLDQEQYIESFQEEIRNTLEKIKALKEQLEFKREEMKAKKKELEKLKKELEEQKATFENEKKSKEVLLEQTKGQERTYQNLLARVQEQKNSILGDIDRLMKEKQKELARIKALQTKPKTGLASSDWYFSQTNPLWANDTIGFSNSLMRNYGCAIACVAMVFKHYGIDIDPGYLARQPIFYYDLIVWPKQWRFLDLVANTYHNGVDWKKIDKEIASGHPVIVFVSADGRNGGHYVVIHSKDATGRYVVHDPIWGPNIYLDSTQQNIGILYGTTTTVDQAIIYH
jgi:peptidoglycan hydrolase CwlO-like protein